MYKENATLMFCFKMHGYYVFFNTGMLTLFLFLQVLPDLIFTEFLLFVPIASICSLKNIFFSDLC